MYGMGASAVEWFDNYLSNRAQCAKVNNCIFSELVVTYGVPQGSILGPLLFIIYINDLVDCLTESRVNLYADDTAIICTGESYLDVILSLCIEMDNVVQWLRLSNPQ